MILWTMQQDTSFIKSPIFTLLSSNLNISDEQTLRIVERRQRIRDLISKLRESLNLIKSLRTAIDSKHTLLDIKITSVKNIATPKQVVQLLLWISQNGDKLSRYVPNFSRSINYNPHVAFVSSSNKDEKKIF